MDLFKVNVIFELEKDNAFKNANSIRSILRRKYNLPYEEGGEVSKMITNYQVNTYGETLYSAGIRKGTKSTSQRIYDSSYRRSRYENEKLLRRLENENEQVRRPNA